MRTELREHYVNMVNYLGLVLGASYEIALHDLSMGDETIIAISNGHVTNRTIGSTLTPQMLNFIAQKRYKDRDHEVNYVSISMDNKVLRSSTIYIKDRGELVGLLCITFDDSKFKAVSNAVMSLCHPDDLLKNTTFDRIDDLTSDEYTTEVLSRNVEEVVDTTVDKVLKEKNYSIDKLKKKQRMEIVAELKGLGVFLIKGAVTEVANKLNISEATIYRYLNEFEETEKE